MRETPIDRAVKRAVEEVSNEIIRPGIERYAETHGGTPPDVDSDDFEPVRQQAVKAALNKGWKHGLEERINRNIRWEDPLDLRQNNSKMMEWSEIASTLARGRTFEQRSDDARAMLSRLRGQKEFTETAVFKANEDLAHHEARVAELGGLLEWMKLKDRRLEAPSDSAWYRLRDARLAGRFEMIGEMGGLATERESRFFKVEPQVFVIAHNWAAAFAGASDFQDGEYPVPFDECVFEFQIDGRRVLVPTKKDESGEPLSMICFQAKEWWYCTEAGSLQNPPMLRVESYPLYRAIYDNVRALCIALDAEVAVTEVVRAPHRLNMARQKQGRTLINDHHVVNLARRSRVESLPSSGEHEAKWHPRLHFRRGHWRHYEEHKTWIRWCLVGNPDLGFIDKHYRA